MNLSYINLLSLSLTLDKLLTFTVSLDKEFHISAT